MVEKVLLTERKSDPRSEKRNSIETWLVYVNGRALLLDHLERLGVSSPAVGRFPARGRQTDQIEMLGRSTVQAPQNQRHRVKTILRQR